MKIVTYPDPVLLRESAPLATIDDEVRARVAEMFALMYEARGIGLAAPQVDWPVRLFVVNLAAEAGQGEERVFINPVMVEKSKTEAVNDEGCLSIPGVSAPVKRAIRVMMDATDLEGRRFTAVGEELFARVLQHEFDHLNGILFVSKVVPSQQKQILKRLREIREGVTSGQE